MKDMLKMERETNLSRRQRQSDGLTWLTLTDWHTTDLQHCVRQMYTVLLVLLDRHCVDYTQQPAKVHTHTLSEWWSRVERRYQYNTAVLFLPTTTTNTQHVRKAKWNID